MYAVNSADEACRAAGMDDYMSKPVERERRPEEVRAALSYLRHPIPSDFWQELRAEGLIRADAPV